MMELFAQIINVNPFVPNATLRFSDVFRGQRKGALRTNRLTYFCKKFHHRCLTGSYAKYLFELGQKNFQAILQSRKKCWPVSSQCSISIPLENVRKPLVL